MKRLLLLILFGVLLAGPAFAATSVIEFTGRMVVALADVSVTTSATLVSGSNADRYVLSCTNTSGSVAVRWGGSDVTATKGQQLPAGASIEIRNTGSVYMIAESGTATVACTEERP